MYTGKTDQRSFFNKMANLPLCVRCVCCVLHVYIRVPGDKTAATHYAAQYSPHKTDTYEWGGGGYMNIHMGHGPSLPSQDQTATVLLVNPGQTKGGGKGGIGRRAGFKNVRTGHVFGLDNLR